MSVMAEMQVGRVFMVRLPTGVDLLEELTRLCREKNIVQGEVRAIGAVTRARIGYYDQAARRYEYLDFEEPLEILALMGNVSLLEGQPMVHAHLTLADEEGRALGGHLAPGTLVFACEACIRELLPRGHGLVRGMDDITGLLLWQEN